MQLCTDNESYAIPATAFWAVVSGRQPEHHAQKTSVFVCKKATSERLLTLAATVGEKLSEVNDVETVFLECDQESGRAYRVLTVIGARNPDVRAQVYQKEQEVMNAFPGVNFSFRVVSRTGRDLSEVMDGVGRLVYKKG